MPWQREVADVALELLPDGSLAYREVIITVARQNGKTTIVLAVECHRSLMWRTLPQKIVYSAQTGQDGKRKFIEDQKPLIENSPLKTLRRRWYESAERTALHWNNGSIITVQGHALAAGHGGVINLGFVDEAFADLDFRREQSMKPAQKTIPDAQTWILSTAGTEESVYLKQKIELGRAAVLDGVNQGICYIEYSADENADSGDRRSWYAANPALGYTITEEVLAHDYATMPEEEFRRADLNIFGRKSGRVIPAALWEEISRPDVAPVDGLVCAFEVSADRSHSAIVVMDSKMRGELIKYWDGTDGVIEWLAKRAKKLNMVVAIDAKGPAATHIPDLKAAGTRLREYGTEEMAQATGRFFDAIAEKRFSVRSNPALDDAASGARKRPVADRFVWARRDALVDIAPLVALTLAYDCTVSTERRKSNVLVAWR